MAPLTTPNEQTGPRLTKSSPDATHQAQPLHAAFHSTAAVVTVNAANAHNEREPPLVKLPKPRTTPSADTNAQTPRPTTTTSKTTPNVAPRSPWRHGTPHAPTLSKARVAMHDKDPPPSTRASSEAHARAPRGLEERARRGAPRPQHVARQRRVPDPLGGRARRRPATDLLDW